MIKTYARIIFWVTLPLVILFGLASGLEINNLITNGGFNALSIIVFAIFYTINYCAFKIMKEVSNGK